MDDPPKPKGDGSTPQFAQDTRVVDFGQNLEVPEIVQQMAGGDPLPEGVTVRFRQIKGPGEERVTEMTKPIVMLGRVEDIADVVVDDEAASRYHAAVAHRDGKFVLTDMESTNGTFLNRRRIGEIALRHEDEIRIGVTVLRFEVVPKT